MIEIQNEVLYKLGRIEASLDEIKVSQADAKSTSERHVTEDKIQFAAFGERIASLELSRAKAIGGAAAISGVVGTIAAILAKTLHLA